jgi:hypothetical protein
MIRRGVRPCVARPQQAGQGLAGRVEEAQQRVEAERVFPGRRRVLFLRMRQHDRRVDVQDEPRQRPAKDRCGRQRLAGLNQLGPGQFPGGRASGPQPGQGRLVDAVQDPPRRGIGGHRPEQARLLPQHRQIRDRLATIGQQHRQIDCDPARLMRRTAHPIQPQRLNETPSQTSLVSHIGEQTGTSMTDHTPSPTSDDNLRTRAGTLHPGSAFRDGQMEPSTSPIVPDQKALSRSRTTPPTSLTEGPRLVGASVAGVLVVDSQNWPDAHPAHSIISGHAPGRAAIRYSEAMKKGNTRGSYGHASQFLYCQY